MVQPPAGSWFRVGFRQQARAAAKQKATIGPHSKLEKAQKEQVEAGS